MNVERFSATDIPGKLENLKPRDSKMKNQTNTWGEKKRLRIKVLIMIYG